MTPKQERLRKAYEFKIGKQRTSKLSDEQILLLSKYYGSLNDSEQSKIDNALAQGRRNDLTDMADAFISENEQDTYEPSDIIKQYDEQFDEAVAAYNKKVEDFKKKEDQRIAGMFQYGQPIGPEVDEGRFREQTNAKIDDYQRQQRIKEILEKRKKKTGSNQYKSPIGPQAMQGPKEPPVQGPRQASKDDEPWESEVQDQLGTKLDNLLEQIRNEPLPQPSKTKRRKSKGKKKLSRKSYTAKELGVGESLNLILENVIETRESLFKLYKLEKERFEFKKKIDKKLTQQLAAKKRERKLEREKKEQTFLQKKIKSAKKTIKQGLLDSLISGAILFALPLIIDGIKGLLPGQRNNKPPSDPNAGSPTSAADQSGGLSQPDVPPKAVPIPVEEYKEPDKTESESEPNTTAEPIKPSAPSVDPGSFGPFNESPLGTYTWNTGGPVPGPRINKDIVPAMLTPGEFVMSRGAVNKFGLNVMMSMNKAGGGTNRPTYKGMLPGYQGGGPVTTALSELKKDEALSSLTRGVNDYVKPGGRSVVSNTPWSSISNDTMIYPYDDGQGNPTIGWGSTFYDNIFSGNKPVRMSDSPITKGRADKILESNIMGIHDKYAKSVPHWNKMSNDQKAGMLVVAWNAPYAYGSYPKYTKAINDGDMVTAAKEVQRGGPSAARIEAERKLLLTGPLDLTKVKEEPKSPSAPGNEMGSPTPAFDAPGSEVRGYQGPPTPGTLRGFSGVGNIMEDLSFNLQVLGAEKRITRGATRGQPPGTNPRRNMNPLQQFLQIFSPTPAPEPPEFIAPTNTQPVGRRSPQQSGS